VYLLCCVVMQCVSRLHVLCDWADQGGVMWHIVF